jgi:ribonuclease E
VAAGPVQGEADIWVELAPAEPARSGRSRRGRGRGRSEQPIAEAVVAETFVEAPETQSAMVEAVAVAELEPEPAKPAAKPRRGRAKAVVVENAPAPEPAAAAVFEPVAQAAPARVLEPVTADPAEISSPPEQPKRGWWRKG